MSKYVNHPGRMTIGSDNVFFIVGEGIPLRDGYRAIVMFNDYRFETINMVNVGVATPAQQMVWYKVPTDGFGRQSSYVLNAFWKRWLDNNVGPEREFWDVRPTYRDKTGPIFFKRRTDALRLVREINLMLTEDKSEK